MDLMSPCTYARDSVLVIVHMDMLRFSFPSCLCTVKLVQSCDTSVVFRLHTFQNISCIMRYKMLSKCAALSVCKKKKVYNISVAQPHFEVVCMIAL